MDFDRRAFLIVTAAAGACSSRLAAQSGPVLRPEDFGARGDGVTSDAPAFAALSAEMNRRGGGTLWLGAKRTYVVGGQVRGGAEFGWTPAPVLDLHDISGPLSIIGNGARLRCQAGLRFGTFDPASDRPVQRHLPNYRRDELASPYQGLIWIRNCSAPVEIRDVELDGNLEKLRIGGPFGDTGWQLPGTGLLLQDNLGPEIIDNIYSHHHGQDGAMIIGDPGRTARSRFTRLICRNNGRQGLSITGGRGYDFADCEFSKTGRSAIMSAPGAGVDIEAEGGRTIRDLSFIRCKFVDNAGVGMLAEAGDSEDVRFANCLFVGTTTWSAWPKKPHYTFDDCTFVGSVVNAFPDDDPARAARFSHCRFTDAASLSPTSAVFTGGGPIANLGKSDNVLFDGCTFELQGGGVLPWSWRATYRDCTMAQRSTQTAMTKGKYFGRTTISGPVDLYGSMILGTVILNGSAVPTGPVGADIKPW
jgi:hypothetical protein